MERLETHTDVGNNLNYFEDSHLFDYLNIICVISLKVYSEV